MKISLSLIISFLLLLVYINQSIGVTISQKFKTRIRLFPIINIEEVKSLTPTKQTTGVAYTYVVAPNSIEAATFNAFGEPDSSFAKSVTQTSIVLKTGNGSTNAQKITVLNFQLDGPSFFDSNGAANNIRVGATFNIKANNVVGMYTGIATLRIIY